MTQPFRSSRGGTAIDRTRPVWFTFDGDTLSAYAGDTLASALLANGVHTVGRSVKYRRPRGIFTAGPEEPNALVTVGSGPERTPKLKATEVAVHNGLTARSQRGWPSVERDIGAINGLLSPFLPAGFYYKTFMRPRWLWPRAEQFLRRAAASAEPMAKVMAAIVFMGTPTRGTTT